MMSDLSYPALVFIVDVSAAIATKSCKDVASLSLIISSSKRKSESQEDKKWKAEGKLREGD